MSRMSFTGVISNGQIIAEEKINLPDGTKVRIEPMQEGPGETLADAFRVFMGVCEGLPSDLARNHEHYLHGAPRK